MLHIFVKKTPKMHNPFLFGKIAENSFFTNREIELKRLNNNLNSGTNTIVISPRRWGKSSLVKKASGILNRKEKDIRVCFIDLFKTRTENEFYEIYAREILKASSSRWQEWAKTAGEMLKKITPKLTMGADPQNDFSISFDWSSGTRNTDEILNMPEKIALKKNIRIIVCIDEFQNLSHYHDSIGFQKLLRAYWQHHKKVTYLLYGSKRHMLIDFFENKSMPFYKFGDVIFLQKILKEKWILFITDAFRRTKKQISNEIAGQIAELMQNHPYFVQQFAQIIWFNTEKAATSKIISDSLQDIIEQNAIIYQKEIESLSSGQINFLKAFSDGEQKYSSFENLKKYNLGSSANVSRIKEALENKEILDFTSTPPIFHDPVFELWFIKHINS